MERIRERYYLSYPRALIKEPILYHLVKKFDLVFNIRGASVSEEMGLVAVEFEGSTDQIERALDNRNGNVEVVRLLKSSLSAKRKDADLIAGLA